MVAVCVDSSGAQANGSSLPYGISSGGRYVVFSSSATNLVSGDTNARDDIFVRERAPQQAPLPDGAVAPALGRRGRATF